MLRLTLAALALYEPLATVSRIFSLAEAYKLLEGG